MESIIRANIIKLLKSALDAIKSDDSFKLKRLSNDNISNASIFQDEDSLSISVILYAISKLIEHTNKKKAVIAHFQGALHALSAGKDAKYREIIKRLIKAIKIEDFRLKRFVSNVIEQAQVKKGCVLCENGLSIEQAASVLNVSRWELMQYLGKTHVNEQSKENISTEKRLALARRLFQ
jgi:AraC-like DNA-binding protein